VEDDNILIIPQQKDQGSYDYILKYDTKVLCIISSVADRHEIEDTHINEVEKCMKDRELIVVFVIPMRKDFILDETKKWKQGVIEINLHDEQVKKIIADEHE